MTLGWLRRPTAGAEVEPLAARRAWRVKGSRGSVAYTVAGLTGLAALVASVEAGAVAPKVRDVVKAPAAQSRVAPSPSAAERTPAKAKPVAKTVEKRVAALPGRTASPAPKPRSAKPPSPSSTKAKTAKAAVGADPKVPLSKVAQATARRHGVDPHLVHAVILAESAYNPKALSHKGAMGLMQLIPQTAARYGVKNAWDPKQNIDGGVRYLSDLLAQFGDIELALAAYNAGEKAVERYGRAIPPFAETQTYVARATSYLARLQSGTSISKLRATGSGVSGRLSGWGVIFGSFPASGEAKQVLRDQRRVLASVVSGGRGAVVHRKHESKRPYAALIVGLNQDKAVKACRHVQGSGGYCLPIPPEQLRDPKALWR